MNEIEVGRVLAFAAAQDPKMPQGDPDGFIRRTWATLLAKVPAEDAQRAVVAYYSGDYYATTREPIVPAVIIQWTNARRRPSEQERTGQNRATRRELPAPPVEPETIHAGIDRVYAALARKRAITAGEDPETAMDIAESQAVSRRLERSVACPHCTAGITQPCVNHRGQPLTKTAAHESRLDAAMGKTIDHKPRTSAEVARAEVLTRSYGIVAGGSAGVSHA